jgi:NAD(P)H-dependent FMN reductase
MTAGTFLAICGSRKPAPGIESRSAARELLRAVVLGMTDADVKPGWLDLRDLSLPLFDGRVAGDYGSEDLVAAAAEVEAANTIVLSVPAYWGGPAGAVKNFFDLLGGATYDLPPGKPLPLAGKVFALLVVGADPVAGPAALGGMRLTLAALGAWVAPRAEVVGNLRTAGNAGSVLATMKDFGTYVAGLTAPVRTGA